MANPDDPAHALYAVFDAATLTARPDPLQGSCMSWQDLVIAETVLAGVARRWPSSTRAAHSFPLPHTIRWIVT
ncbi:hypothetical protein AB0L34_25900 [Micromonospora sp. NPDC052213]|uniref:hypothetical protein n=1 Tax=Micromonospora sp. NPDC052213 TaxID=3155812 RepID=UPI003415E9B6